MTWGQCALSSSSIPPSSTTTSPKTLASSIRPSPSQSKPTKRRNSLRPKILKTLKKPHPTTPLLPFEKPIMENPPEHKFEIPIDTNLEEFVREAEKEQALSSETIAAGEAGGVDSQFMITTNPVVGIVLFGVGFVIQSLCVAWYLDKKESKSEDGEEGEVKVMNGVEKEGVLLDKGGDFAERSVGEKVNGEVVVQVDNAKTEEMIVEIRAMAREVREKEARELGTNGSVSGSDVIEVKEDEKVPLSKVKNTIFEEVDNRLSRLEKILRLKREKAKEVDNRLSRLEKSLRLKREKAMASAVSFLNGKDMGKDNKELERSGVEVKGENLLFKKKFKFKGSPAKPGDIPKGFGSTKNSAKPGDIPKGFGSTKNSTGKSRTKTQVKYEIGRNGSDIVDSSVGVMDVTSDNLDVEKEAGRNLSENKLISVDGTGSNSDNGAEVLKSRAGTKNVNIEIGSEEVENKPIVARSGNTGREVEDDLWWMNLPYALAIFLRTDSENGGPSGLYSINMDEGSSSYAIAFEDRHDATNFCYTLESFFEDLGGVDADVVLLSKEELVDAAKSRSMKIIVVRKGQLKLYAGQSLEEVELALRSEVKVEDEKFMFKENLNFKGFSVKPGRNPKGFGSTKSSTRKSITKTPHIYIESDSDSDNDANDVVDSSYESSLDMTVSKTEEKEVGMDLSENLSIAFDGHGSKKEGKILKSKAGLKNENIKQSSEKVGVRHGDFNELGVLKEEDKVNKRRTKFEEVENRPIVKRSKNKGEEVDDDLWWMSLPYALTIVLHRDSKNGGPGGLYSIKTAEGSSSYMVAFEDRRDANNFCYILESYFKDLGDVDADVILLSKEELIDASKRKIVLRKGQLKLYAGQPLEEVEFALRSYMR